MHFRKTFLYAFTLTFGVFTGFVAVAWTGPTGTAPNNNTDAPINVGSTAQSKAGGLVLNTGGATNGLITYGNAGIGTAAPNPLGVAASVYGRVLTIANSTANARALLELWTNAAPTANQIIGQISFLSGTAPTGAPAAAILSTSNGTNANSGNLAFYTSPSSGSLAQRMIIDPNGTVIIGNTVGYTGSRLSVDSNGSGTWAEIVNYGAGSPSGGYGIYSYGTVYAFYGSGPVYATAFYYTSDERLKKNIETIASSTALTKVLALNQVTFNWIAKDKPQGTQIGFIAQQVEKVVPELILTDPESGLKAVDYARVVPLLTGAIQQQQAQIEAQQKEIDDLKAKVEALTTR